MSTPSRLRSRLELEPLEDRQLLSGGGLDPTFAAAGRRTIPLPDGNATAQATAVAVQKDGKVVLAGAFTDGNKSGFAVVRLNADGTTDGTFGDKGTLLVQLDGATADQVGSLVIDPLTQKMLVAGTMTTTDGQTTDQVFAVARIKPDGTLDKTLNGDGKATVEVGGKASPTGGGAVNITLTTALWQASGKILLSGSLYVTNSTSPNTEAFVVARLNNDGSADQTFNSSGVASVSVNPASTSAAGGAAALAVQSDGKLLVAGTSGTTTDPDPLNSFTVVRLNTFGRIDTSFGPHGRQTFGIGTNLDNEATAIALQSDGKILVGGSTAANFAVNANADFAVARLNPNGALDTTFNGSGTQTAAFDLGGSNADRVSALALQADGKILAAGSAAAAPPAGTTAANLLFALARFNSDGSADTNFATNGKSTFSLGSGGPGASAVAVQPDGRIVAVGSVALGSGASAVSAMAVARVLGNDQGPDTVGVFDPNSAMWYLRDVSSAGTPSIAPFAYGGKNWVPVVGDWTGDGQKSIGVFDPSTATWYLKNDNSPGAPSFTPFQYGEPGWIPVVGDWNGDGKDTIGIVDPKTETWYLRNDNSPGAPDITPFQYGAPGWIPVAGDWGGSGTTGVGVVDPKTMAWYLKNSDSAGAPDFKPFVYGPSGAKPVVGDWNGDGATTAGYYAGGHWYLRNSNSAGSPDLGTFAYGAGSWTPVAGSWSLPVAPLVAAHGPNKNNPVTDTVSDQDLNDTVSAALERLSAAGADPALLGQLAAAKVTFGQLAPGQLGYVNAATNQITLDATAAGYGWFVDSTPLQDEEFQNGRVAAKNSPAAGSMDLLSAVMLELAQLAGLDRMVASLRTLKLNVGERNVAAVLSVFSALEAVPVTAPASTPTSGN
jgi:uncharacterized delta-60 repeat protein